MQNTHSSPWNRSTGIAVGWVTGALLALGVASVLAGDWKEEAISPVTTPVYFEDPQINSEVRPIFAYHNIGDDFVTGGGNAQFYAVQLRWAVTERLAIIAVKDGYLDLKPNAVVPKKSGWADIAAGVKYALIDDKEAEFIVTPGITIELPTGQAKVLQGEGDGTWNPFVSVGKGLGKAHLVGNVGGIVPNNFAEDTAQVHYSLQLDYAVHRYFTPLVAVSAFTVLSEGKGLPLDVEGFDLFNFGSANASGTTEAVVGFGFRSRLASCLDLGFAYEIPLTDEKGLFGDRFTVDLIWRF